MKARGAIEAGRASRGDLAAVARSRCLAATTAASSHRLCRMQAASMQVACQEKKKELLLCVASIGGVGRQPRSCSVPSGTLGAVCNLASEMKIRCINEDFLKAGV